MRQLILAAALAAVCGVACAQEDTNLYYRVFTSVGQGDCQLSREERNRDVKAYLAQQYHVGWPVGSEAVFVEDGHQVVVRNTQSNLNVLAEALAPLLAGCQIAFEFQVFAFNMKDVEKLLNGDGVSCEGLMELRKKGRARLVTTARSVTRSGQEAVVKDIQEILYPTDMDGMVGTNQVDGAWTVVPCNFEMREIGTILQLIPEFDREGNGTSINVMLNPQWVSLNRWETFDACAGSKGNTKKVPLRQPVIGVSSIQTQLKLESGETVLLGGGKAMDGDWVQYHFLKAWLVWSKLPK